MILKDEKSPNSLNKEQKLSLEKELKPLITRLQQPTEIGSPQKEKQALATSILVAMQQYLTDNGKLNTECNDIRLYTQEGYTIITQLNKELSKNVLTVKGLEVASIVILSNSTVLDAFEQVLWYLFEFEPQLNPQGDVYYIIPSGNEDFTVYRFGLNILQKQYQNLIANNLL